MPQLAPSAADIDSSLARIVLLQKHRFRKTERENVVFDSSLGTPVEVCGPSNVLRSVVATGSIAA